MKTFWFLLLIIIPLTHYGQGSFFFDEFSGPLDTAWKEIGSSGRIFTSNGRMVMDYRQDLNPKPKVRRSFGPASDKLFLSFTLNSERNWVTVFVNLLNSQEDTLVQLIIDDGNGDGFLVADSLLPDGNFATYTKVSDGFTKNVDYDVLMEVDIPTQRYSISINGAQTQAGIDLPFLANGSDLATVEIFQRYMFNSNGDTTLQNFYFDNFAVSDIDKSQLGILLAEANSLANGAIIGNAPGQYPQSAFQTFSLAIQAAQSVLDDPNATQAEIDQATIDLQAAINAFTGSQNIVSLTFDIDTSQGIQLEEGMSGFNVRIIDNTYTYTHPEFQKAIDTLNAGWLRYFSGTTGDAYNARTGYFELEWADQMVKEGETNDPNAGFFRHYKLSDAKGAYRLHDLYQLLGDNEAKLIITFNGFTDLPENIAALAKFCRDNHILVEDWQMCNEPYFFVPGRKHYFFRNGRDYATKMKAFADSIRAYDPDALISLNYGWDDMGGFSSGTNGIKSYENPYWDILGKHSYAAFGQSDAFSRALTRMNGGLAFLTEESMARIQDTEWPNEAPVNITEWNTFNNALSNTYMNGMYAAEYLLRMMDFDRIGYLGHHRLSSSAGPRVSRAGMIEAAYDGNFEINPDTILEGLSMRTPGVVFRLFNEAINQSTFKFDGTLIGTQIMLSANNQNGNATEVEAMYAQALKGNYGYDYALFTNKSNILHSVVVQLQGLTLGDTLFVTYLTPEEIQSPNLPNSVQDTVVNGTLNIPPYAITLAKWKKGKQAPLATRIYGTEVTASGVMLKWWKRNNADGYTIRYGLSPTNLDQSMMIQSGEMNTTEITGLNQGLTYYFTIEAFNGEGTAPMSNLVQEKINVPSRPALENLRVRNGRLDAEWWSVSGATAYKLLWGTTSGSYTDTLDVGNIIGGRIKGIASGETYYCAVMAYNGLGESSLSNELSVESNGPLPYPPLLVRANENLSSGDVLVQWVVSDSSYGGTHTLYRSTHPYGDWQEIATSLTGNLYTDTSPLGTDTYYYALKSENSAGKSNFFSHSGVLEKQIDTHIDEALDSYTGYHPLHPKFDQQFMSYEIRLFDLVGRELYQTTSTSELNAISNGGHLKPAIYIWKVNGQTQEGKFVQYSGKLRVP